MTMNQSEDNIMINYILEQLMTLATDLIVKNKKIADSYETLESLRESDYYMMAMEKRGGFKDYYYDEEVLRACNISEEQIPLCLENKYNIPEQARDTVLITQRQYIINNYEEKNNYYRMLAGMPNIGQNPINITEKIENVDTTKQLYQMSAFEIAILENLNILQELREKYPTRKYLNYLGKKKISIYTARKAKKFSILYIPVISSKFITDSFKDYYYKFRTYVLENFYNNAFKDSRYYDSVMGIMILFMTIQRVITEHFKSGMKRDFYDVDSIRNIFESYGVTYYSEIPMVYQRRLIKNLNNLLENKGTDTVFVDICKLFGYEDVNLFHYYLLKIHKKDANGNYIFEYTTDELGNTVLDYDKTYDLKFAMVPINEKNVDIALQDNSNYLDYEEVTSEDIYWGGDIDKSTLKNEILKLEFNKIQTKYMSINSMYRVTELIFELDYFFRLLLDLEKYETSLTIQIPSINQSIYFKIFDSIVTLFALFCEKRGYGGEILDTSTKVASIYGFNFNADLTALNQMIINGGFQPKDFGVDQFTIPNEQILLPSQLINIFFKNKAIYNILVEKLQIVDNIDDYILIKKIYDALMTTSDINRIYKKSDNTLATSYMDFLSDRNIIIYNHLTTIFQDSNKIELINDLINEILSSLQNFIDSDRFKYLFTNIPDASSESLKSYIFKVINFFKSYDIDMMSMTTMYIFDDEFTNTIKIIDKLEKTKYGELSDIPPIIDKLLRSKSISQFEIESVPDEFFLAIDITKEDVISILHKLEFIKIYEDSMTIDTNFNDKLELFKSNLLSDTFTFNDNFIYSIDQV